MGGTPTLLESSAVKRLPPILLLALPFLASAEEEEAQPSVKIPAVSLLPYGSVLESVMVPRYDKNRKLIEVSRASKITLESASRISGEDISMERFHPDGRKNGRIDLGEAIFDQTEGILTAEKSVRIDSERLIAEGTALVYHFETREGFLSGPASITIATPPAETAMNTRPSPLRATALLGASLLALPVLAEPPPRLTPDEIAALEKDAAPLAETAGETAAATQRELADATTASDGARRAATSFLRRSGMTLIADEAEKRAEETPDAAPLEVEPDPTLTFIHCEDGAYFHEAVLVFLKNVTVKDPRFELSGANELKVFFAAKPEKEPREEKDPGAKDDGMMNLGKISEGFGDPERIVATGAVKIIQKGVDGDDPIEASGAILSYEIKTGQIIISGGFPWVKQGNRFFRATRPNEKLRILTSGSFVTEGHWELGTPLNQER